MLVTPGDSCCFITLCHSFTTGSHWHWWVNFAELRLQGKLGKEPQDLQDRRWASPDLTQHLYHSEKSRRFLSLNLSTVNLSAAGLDIVLR